MRIAHLRLLWSNVLVLLFFVPTLHAQTTIGEYLRVHGYTPSPTHDTRWVPGGLIRVNWKSGKATYVRPRTDFQTAQIDTADTEQLDFDFNASAKGGKAAGSAVTALLGKVGVNINGENDYTFSGVSFTVKALDAEPEDIQKILDDRSGATYKYLASKENGLLFDTYDVYLITEVDYATSASITSDKSFSVSVGVGADASDPATCKLPSIPKTSAEDKNNSPAQQDPAAAPAAQQTNATSKPKTTKPAATADGTSKSPTTVQNAQNKADNSSSSSAKPSVTVGYDQCSEKSGQFTSKTPIPTALKVIEIYLNTTGDLLITHRGDNVSLPLDAPALLKRTTQCNVFLEKLLPSCRRD